MKILQDFAEYYKKEHPEWTVEQCEEEAKRIFI